MIIFELLALRLPYLEVKQNWRISQCIVEGIAPELPGFAETQEYQPLVRLFKKCTSFDPSNRPNASKLKAKLKLLSDTSKEQSST